MIGSDFKEIFSAFWSEGCYAGFILWKFKIKYCCIASLLSFLIPFIHPIIVEITNAPKTQFYRENILYSALMEHFLEGSALFKACFGKITQKRRFVLFATLLIWANVPMS